MLHHPPIGIRVLRAAPWNTNPLMRPADRALAVLRLLTVLVCLSTIPFAAAVGTSVYEDNSARIHADAASKTLATATVIDDPTPAQAADRSWQARVRWDHDGHLGEATVPVTATTARNDRVSLWLGPGNAPTEPPVWPGAAVVAGSCTAAGVVAAAGLLGAGICAATGRIMLRHHTRRLDTEWRQFSLGHR